MAQTIPAVSVEYCRALVGVTISGLPYDPTHDTVQMAFMAPGATPGPSDWKTASWEVAGAAYYAICLVGNGATVTLTAGSYDVWVKVWDSPEVPARKALTLIIV